MPSVCVFCFILFFFSCSGNCRLFFSVTFIFNSFVLNFSSERENEWRWFVVFSSVRWCDTVGRHLFIYRSPQPIFHKSQNTFSTSQYRYTQTHSHTRTYSSFLFFLYTIHRSTLAYSLFTIQHKPIVYSICPEFSFSFSFDFPFNFNAFVCSIRERWADSAFAKVITTSCRASANSISSGWITLSKNSLLCDFRFQFYSLKIDCTELVKFETNFTRFNYALEVYK